MANVTPDKIVISPAFIAPEGAGDIFTIKGDLVESISPDYIDEGEEGLEDADDTALAGVIDSEDGTPITLETPTFVVFDQDYARAPGGQMLIDVIIQINDVSGAIDYEVQVDRL